MKRHHQVNVQPIYFEMIQRGKKTVEGRIAKPKYQSFSVDDTLVFQSGDFEVATRVIEVKKFTSFRQMLNHYGTHSCVPNINDIEEAINVYHSFPNYAEDEKKFGVIGIKIELI